MMIPFDVLKLIQSYSTRRVFICIQITCKRLLSTNYYAANDCLCRVTVGQYSGFILYATEELNISIEMGAPMESLSKIFIQIIAKTTTNGPYKLVSTYHDCCRVHDCGNYDTVALCRHSILLYNRIKIIAGNATLIMSYDNNYLARPIWVIDNDHDRYINICDIWYKCSNKTENIRICRYIYDHIPELFIYMYRYQIVGNFYKHKVVGHGLLD